MPIENDDIGGIVYGNSLNMVMNHRADQRRSELALNLTVSDHQSIIT